MKRRIGYVVVATVAAFIGCATKRSGLDSESHFACDSNADCAEHAPNLACVERRCVPVPQMTSSASNSEQGPVETMESWVTRTWYNDATVTGVDPGPVHGACVPTDVWPDGAAVSCRAVAFPTDGGPCDCSRPGLREASPELLAAIRSTRLQFSDCDTPDTPACDDLCGCEVLPFSGSMLSTCQQELTSIPGTGWCDVEPARGGNPALTMTTLEPGRGCPFPSSRILRTVGIANHYVYFACTGMREAPANAAAASPGDIGDPCTPRDEYSPTFFGFLKSDAAVELRSPSCSTGVCLVANFQGRTSCPYGQSWSDQGLFIPPDLPADERCYIPGAPQEPANAIQVEVFPQLLSRRAETSVYCSCRCDGPPGEAPFCACPDGFECRHLIDDYQNASSDKITGSYCIKAGTPDPTTLGMEACDRSLATCDD